MRNKTMLSSKPFARKQNPFLVSVCVRLEVDYLSYPFPTAAIHFRSILPKYHVLLQERQHVIGN